MFCLLIFSLSSVYLILIFFELFIFQILQVTLLGNVFLIVICIISFGRIQKKITFAMENQERYDL